MQSDDDIAFQRAILADPADATLKLVYADWLQDRADPRAGFVRAQVEGRPPPECEFDPAWVAFMTTLAQPFGPITSQEGVLGHPFTELTGERGRIVTFESQYRAAHDWSTELLADLAFLTAGLLDRPDDGFSDPPFDAFLCDATHDQKRLTPAEVLAAIKTPNRFYPDGIPDEGTCRIRPQFERQSQFLFGHAPVGEEMLGAHGRLKRYVTGGELWYVALRVGERTPGTHRYELFDTTLVTVGSSPCGERLVGAITKAYCGMWS